MNIELMMLQVLDDPTGVRIIVETSYPDLSQEDGSNAYFMIDRSDGDEDVFDYWWVTDSLGQSHKFDSNVELIEFFESIEELISTTWVESF